jgi:hypothetical protein
VKFLQFYKLFSESPIQEDLDSKGNPIPSKESIKKFHQTKNNYRPDYSKDPLNIATKSLFSISSKISDEKLRNKFAEVIYRNMGNLENLLKNIRKLNQDSINNSEQENIEKMLRRFENDL